MPSAEIIRNARLRLLRMHYEAGVGHIGGNLSALDILLTLYHDVLKLSDRFVLSKGHAAGAIYVALASAGLIDAEELNTFHKDGTRLQRPSAGKRDPARPLCHRQSRARAGLGGRAGARQAAQRGAGACVLSDQRRRVE